MQTTSGPLRLLRWLTRPWLWRLRLLELEDLAADPVEQFERWFRCAARSFWVEFPEAVCVATVAEDGSPQARMVLLKEFDQRGFVFYTNSESAKGRALAVRPQAALTFYWEGQQRQVRLEGVVEVVDAREADSYFASRAYGSRIGAWASLQSRPLESRVELDERVAQFEREFGAGPVPRPAYWTGYRVVPQRFEFWQMRKSRLHDRFEYIHSERGTWRIQRLFP